MTGTTDDADGPEIAPFGRRSFLATAALAAAAPVTAAAPAEAVEPPADDPFPGPVARLLAVPGGGRGVGWLRAALQVAAEIELSTIPPYLCAWWSVTDRGCEAARLIQRIVGDEMYHLGVVCNLLAAVGGRPRLRRAAPVYPGPLPGGVRAGVNVYLSGLTRSFVHDVMMAIEAPDEPLARKRELSPGIGDFYGGLLEAFHRTAPELSAEGQLSSRIGADELKPVANLDDVEQAIEIIKEQGEGTAGSPADAYQDDHPAHYYAFAEIYHGRQLRRTEHGWHFTGAPVPFPEARPMARVPAGGWPDPPEQVQRLLDRFDGTYTDVLAALEDAWSGGGSRSLGAAIRSMRAMEAPAVELMEIPLHHRPGTYGPQFRCS
ncbi:ferritin-like protein [Streptomyces sp. NPDC127190]|uniref:ferritin-like domain-containing protein n=1 Tax=unclassified Streptomyces TaxID=2593676 RepID=UPI00363668BF